MKKELKTIRRRAEVAAGTRTTLVIGDVHIPAHDQKAVDLVLEWIEDQPVDRVILNGDIIDAYEISRWLQPGSRGVGLAEEIRMGREFLGSIRRALGPKGEILWIEGNHCFRFKSYIMNQAPSIAELEHNVTIQDQLQFDLHGVEFVECRGSKWFSTYIEAAPGVLVGHFNKTSINAGYAVKGLLDKYGASIITGHGHCMGTSHRTHHDGPIFGYEGGCLCDLSPTYCEPSHWAQGFIVIREIPGAPKPTIERVVIDAHSFSYGGVFYG